MVWGTQAQFQKIEISYNYFKYCKNTGYDDKTSALNLYLHQPKKASNASPSFLPNKNQMGDVHGSALSTQTMVYTII